MPVASFLTAIEEIIEGNCIFKNYSKFTNKIKTTSNLKALHQKKTKNTTEKTHEDELCKESQQVEWLFNI